MTIRAALRARFPGIAKFATALAAGAAFAAGPARAQPTDLPSSAGPTPPAIPEPRASAAPLATPAAADYLPPCVVAHAKLLTKLDSSVNIAGDAFAFALIDAVAADGTRPEIPAGTRGRGVVTYVERSDFNGQPGRIIVEPRFLLLPDGTRVQALVDPQSSQTLAQGKTRDLFPALQFVPGMGLVVNGYNALHHGTEIVLEKGTRFLVIVGDELATGDCYVPAPPPAGP